MFSIFKFSKLFPFSDFFEASSCRKHSQRATEDGRVGEKPENMLSQWLSDYYLRKEAPRMYVLSVFDPKAFADPGGPSADPRVRVPQQLERRGRGPVLPDHLPSPLVRS